MIGNGAGGNVRIDRRKSGHGLTRRPARGRTCASPDPHLDRCGVLRSESRCASCRWTSAVRGSTKMREGARRFLGPAAGRNRVWADIADVGHGELPINSSARSPQQERPGKEKARHWAGQVGGEFCSRIAGRGG